MKTATFGIIVLAVISLFGHAEMAQTKRELTSHLMTNEKLEQRLAASK